MSGMVERVARAIQASDDAEPFSACACSGKASPKDFACPCKMEAAKRRARAAIAALRDYIYQAMIDAALSPQEKGE